MAKQNFDPTDAMMMGNGLTMDLTKKPDTATLTEAAEGKKPVGKPVTGGKIDQENAQVFDPTTVIKRTPPRDKGVDEMFGALDAAVEREKQDISRRMKELEGAMYEEHVNGEAYKDEASDPDYERPEGNNGSDIERQMVGTITPKQAMRTYGMYDPEGNKKFSEKQIEETSDEDLKDIQLPKKEDETFDEGPDEYEDDIIKQSKTTTVHMGSQSIDIPYELLDTYKSIGWKTDEDLEAEESSTVEETPSKAVEMSIESAPDENSYDEVDTDDIEKDIEDEDKKAAENQKKQEEEMKEIIDGLKVASKQTIKSSTLDLSKFSIGETKIKASTLIVESEESTSDIADWCIYNAGRAISASGLSGPELIRMDPENSTRNRTNTLKDSYKILYDHIIDSKKPDFDTWLKQTLYSDLNHIYFAVYQATFHGSNFVSYQCPDCKKVFIKDVDFKDMVKYKDEETKNKVKEMVQQDHNNGIIKYKVDLVPAGNRFVFGMKRPSLYNVVMETAGLPDSIIEKYGDLIDTIMYIDSVYVVDNINMKLNPVQIPVVKGDPIKSTAKRIRTLNDILKKLTSDEYYALRGYISNANNEAEDVTYLNPAAECPDCGKKIDAIDPMEASDLLFTRHHLGAFASM